MVPSDETRPTAPVQSQHGDEADKEELGFGVAAAAVNTFKSGGIMDVLEDLKEKAESEFADLRKAGGNTKCGQQGPQ